MADCSLCRTPLAVGCCNHVLIVEAGTVTMSRSAFDSLVAELAQLRNLEADLEDIGPELLEMLRRGN